MIPENSVPPAGALSEATRELLRAALRDSLAHGDAANEAMNRALRAASDEAREKRLRVEELVLELKAIVRAVAPSHITGDEKTWRDWVVTQLIKAYYSRPA